MVFNELKEENSIDLIYLNSQLAAEKARSVYFCSVLDLKRNNEDLDFQSLQMRLSTGSSEDQLNPFSDLKDLLKQDAQDYYTQRTLTRRFSERFSVNINETTSENKTKLKKCERKLEKLDDLLDEKARALHNEQMKNESLKELVLGLEEKAKKKDLIISNLKGELKICEIELEEVEKLRENNETAIRDKVDQDTKVLKDKLESCQAKFTQAQETNKKEMEKFEGQVRELTNSNNNLQRENQQLSKKILNISQELEKSLKKVEKNRENLLKNFESEKKLMEIEYIEKIDALKLSLKAYENMQDLHSCSENTDNELCELEDINRKNSDSCAYTLISLEKPISFESIKIVDYIESANDESMTSIKSFFHKMNSTCQTENEFISIEKYDELVVFYEKLMENFHENEEKLEILNEKLEVLINFSEFFAKFAEKTPIRDCRAPEDFKKIQEFFIDMNKDLENCKIKILNYQTQETHLNKCINLSLQAQEATKIVRKNTVRTIPNKRKSLLFWPKSNPIVTSLFGNI